MEDAAEGADSAAKTEEDASGGEPQPDTLSDVHKATTHTPHPIPQPTSLTPHPNPYPTKPPTSNPYTSNLGTARELAKGAAGKRVGGKGAVKEGEKAL